MLKFFIHKPVMPIKGMCSQVEKEEESQLHFVETKNKHSVSESNINEIEYRGLDRCPDRGYPHFPRYVSLRVCVQFAEDGVQLVALDRLDVQHEHLKKKRA